MRSNAMRYTVHQRHAHAQKRRHQLNTLPWPPNPANPLKPFILPRGLPRPFSYNHLLFNPTLALLLFVGVPMLPRASKSLVVLPVLPPRGELRLDWKLRRLRWSPPCRGDGAKGEPETLRLLKLPSSGEPVALCRPPSGLSEAPTRILFVLLCGVPDREYRGGVTHSPCSSGVAGLVIGGRPRWWR